MQLNRLLLEKHHYWDIKIEPYDEFVVFKEIQGNKHDEFKELVVYTVPYDQIIRLEQWYQE